MRTKADMERLLRREVYASAKDVRQMVDAVHNACVELGECGDLVMAGKCDPIEFPVELIRACAHVCSLAGGLSDHLLAQLERDEEHGT